MYLLHGAGPFDTVQTKLEGVSIILGDSEPLEVLHAIVGFVAVLVIDGSVFLRKGGQKNASDEAMNPWLALGRA